LPEFTKIFHFFEFFSCFFQIEKYQQKIF
jgi:hypothetical protein